MAVAELGFIVLGYLLGQDGKPSQTLIITPAGTDGRPASGALPPLQNLGLAGPGGSGVAMVLEPISKPLVKNLLPRGNNITFYGDEMVDAYGAAHLVIYVYNTSNQTLTIQVVGAETDAPASTSAHFNIGSSYSLAAAASVSFEVNLDQVWHPFLGVVITTGAAGPTAGGVTVQVKGEKWIRFQPEFRARA